MFYQALLYIVLKLGEFCDGSPNGIDNGGSAKSTDGRNPGAERVYIRFEVLDPAWGKLRTNGREYREFVMYYLPFNVGAVCARFCDRFELQENMEIF